MVHVPSKEEQKERFKRGIIDYVPPPTVRDFILSDAPVKCIIGPLGSGKSMGAIFELFRRACEQEPDSNGIRHTKYAVIRNTLDQLRETFLADTTNYLGKLFHYKVSRSTLEFRFKLPDGTSVRSDWHLIPLEKPEDTRRLLSRNLTAALAEECRELNYDVINAVIGRTGRFPHQTMAPLTWKGLLLVSNPWSESSPWHENFVINKPESWDFFHQPGAFEPNAENVENLSPTYYQDLMQGASDEFIRVHVHSMFGEDLSGVAVYKASFKKDVHVTDLPIRPNPSLPIVIGMDFGRDPAAVFLQRTIHGQILCIEEIVSENMGLHQFCETKLMPVIREKYQRQPIVISGDPSGTARSYTSEENAWTVLKQYNLNAFPATTNKIDERIRAVERILVSSIGHKPTFIISNHDAPTLVKGFIRDYKYARMNTGKISPKPEKNKFSHPHDALQYAALAIESPTFMRRATRIFHKPPTPKQKPISPAAWT